MEHPINMDDWGVPLFPETSKFEWKSTTQAIFHQFIISRGFLKAKDSCSWRLKGNDKEEWMPFWGIGTYKDILNIKADDMMKFFLNVLALH